MSSKSEQTKFSVKLCFKKISEFQKIKIKILLNEKTKKKGKSGFNSFQNIGHLLGPKLNLATYEGERVCMSLSRNIYIFLYNIILIQNSAGIIIVQC